ncbi:toprim domain-containing protein [Streptomyces sp. NPDC059708]|uniref:toprim domain-containing protein n=1 Tax=Streptomyces sp. NPDC059708 TaxID=3346916 RepID=UPI003688B299
MPVPSKSTQDYLKEAARQYVTDLSSEEGASGLDWLAGRMIDPLSPEAAKFGLGFVANPLPGHEQYKGCIAIPYIAGDTVVKMRFRTLSESATCKYLDMPGGSPRPYNVRALTRYSPYICLTEGEFDAMAAEAAGMPAVGLPGAESWRPEWSRLLKQYRTVYMLQDGDEAGSRLTAAIGKDVPNLRAIPMGDSKEHDVNQYLIDHGREALKQKVGV